MKTENPKTGLFTDFLKDLSNVDGTFFKLEIVYRDRIDRVTAPTRRDVHNLVAELYTGRLTYRITNHAQSPTVEIFL